MKYIIIDSMQFSFLIVVKKHMIFSFCKTCTSLITSEALYYTTSYEIHARCVF